MNEDKFTIIMTTIIVIGILIFVALISYGCNTNHKTVEAWKLACIERGGIIAKKEYTSQGYQHAHDTCLYNK